MLGKKKKEVIPENYENQEIQYAQVSSDHKHLLELNLAQDLRLLIDSPFLLATPETLAILDQFKVPYTITSSSLFPMDEYMNINLVLEARSALIKYICNNDNDNSTFYFEQIKSISDLMMALGYDADDELTIDVVGNYDHKHPKLTIYSKKDNQTSLISKLSLDDVWKRLIIENETSKIEYREFAGNTIRICEKQTTAKSQDQKSDICFEYSTRGHDVWVKFSNEQNHLRLTFQAPHNIDLFDEVDHDKDLILSSTFKTVIEYLKAMPVSYNFGEKQNLIDLLDLLVGNDLATLIRRIEYTGENDNITLYSKKEKNSPIEITYMQHQGATIKHNNYSGKSEGYVFERTDGKNIETYDATFSEEQRLEHKNIILAKVEQAKVFKDEIEVTLNRERLIRTKKALAKPRSNDDDNIPGSVHYQIF